MAQVAQYEAGDLDRAAAVLSDGFEVAARAGVTSVQARIEVSLIDVRSLLHGGYAEALAESERAAAVLESDGDLEGLAEALTLAGRFRFWTGDVAGSEEVLERAIACARRSGNHRAQMRASHWLAVTFQWLPIPMDVAVARAEQLLEDARGDLWGEADLLKPLCVLYAYTGRAADARAAIDRTQSIFARFGAELTLAESGIPAAVVGLVIGDPALAERYARTGYQKCRAMGRLGEAIDLGTLLADALYDQGRFDEAQQMIGEVQADATPDKTGSTWLTEAKLLARRGEFDAARQLLEQEEAYFSPAGIRLWQADILEARAEVERLAGAPVQAASALRAALQIYQDLRATPLADRVKAALASLTARPDALS